MTHLRSRRPPGRRGRSALRAGAALAAAALTMLAAFGPAPATAKDSELLWHVVWSAPTTSTGPNLFAHPVEVAGTASYELGSVNHVGYTVTTDSGLPDACGPASRTGNANLSGGHFVVRPNLACNGPYHLSVVAASGSGMLTARSQPITAPLSLADPGTAPAGFNGVVDGSTRTVTVSWAAVAGPDVVGYRVRRDGVAVADVPASDQGASDVTPSDGTFSYDVETLHWGAGGPGSAPVASPPTAPLVATVARGAPPTPVVPSGAPGSSDGSSTGSGGGSGSASAPAGAPATSGPLPAGPSAQAGLTSRAGFRSGGSISLSVPTTTADTGFSSNLPYQAQTASDAVNLASPDHTRTVSRTVAAPGHGGLGLVAPVAVALVLLAAALQVRVLLGRAAALAGLAEPAEAVGDDGGEL